ncbi:MAG: peptidylprolyl isomerase [Ardenticatenaceae bacterium]|nr:peptidylprolyl isomerase [Ardenticatenaceae bacterium]
MNSKLSQWCEGLIEAGWIAAIIVVPLFFNIHSDRVFEPDKLTLLRSIAVLMSVAWLVRFIDRRDWQQVKSWVQPRGETAVWRIPFVLPIFLLVISYLISTIFSVSPSVSLAGSYQRLQGTYTTYSYIVVFALIATIMRTREQVNRLVTFAIITSIPVAFYGFLQHFDYDPLPWAGSVVERVAGHMGNAIFIGAYLIMIFPLTLSRIISAFNSILNDEELSSADVIRASIYIFILFLQLFTIIWSGSRGPWLGLGVGLFAFVLILLVALRNAVEDRGRFRAMEAVKAVALVLGGAAVAYLVASLLVGAVARTGRFASLTGGMTSFVAFLIALAVPVLVIFIMVAARRGWRWLWLSWIVMAVSVSAWVVLFNVPADVSAPLAETPVAGNVLDTLDSWRELPRVGRLGQLLQADDGTGRVRTLIWEGALKLITPHEPLNFPNGGSDTWNFLRPLIGYGPESMYVAYNRFYPPELATLESRNASPDRSHNETFDALVITGLLGFAIWQIIYLSVFYFGFRWLGVLRTKFERNLLIGLWVGMGALSAILFSIWQAPSWLGVAFPFGSIAGLVVYLVYYAFFSPVPEEKTDPFSPDRLLLAGLLAAVLAHYVEVHFGIAIAATRLHFFTYVGLMLVVGYILPRWQEVAAAAPAPVTGRGRKRRAPVRPEGNGLWGPVLLSALMLTLMIGILGFEFTTFTPVPGVTYQDTSDLPVSEIFQQSFFQDPGNNFADSPYAFVMLVLTWALGTVLVVAEMVKSGELEFPEDEPPLPNGRSRLVGAAFIGVGLVSLGWRFLVPPPPDAGANWYLGRMALLLWAALCLWAAVRLLFNLSRARLMAGLVALTGLLFALPVLVAGSVGWGLATAVIGAALLWLVWYSGWRTSVVPVSVIAAISFSVALIFTYAQAALLQASLFVRPTEQLDTIEKLLAFRVREASQSSSFLTFVYAFVIILLLLSAFALASHRMAQIRSAGTTAGYASLAVLVLVGLYMISATNMRIIQADMVYKRGKPFDQQAAQQQDVQGWDTAIAIYEKAIDMAPREDFYYLFLGRAFLERSTLTEDPAEKEALLNEASQQLRRAQDINPLNTDHTANLARLNTRWTELSQDEAERAQHLTNAETYYQEALSLSPQNSVIRNEYARLAFSLENDCDKALAIYDDAVSIDPYYEANYFGRSDTLVACAASLPEAEKTAYYEKALADIKAGLKISPNNLQAWLRAGQLSQDLGNYAEAIDAYEEVRTLNTNSAVPPWQVDYVLATLNRDANNLDQAVVEAQKALQTAPAESSGQVQALLAELTGEPVPTPEATPEAAVPVPQAGERPLAQIAPAARNSYYDSPPPMVIDPNGSYEAIITTAKGQMRLRLFPDVAPLAVNNFVFLANQGFYDGTTFHRVLDGFMAQGGDPTGSGMGGPGYQFANETSEDVTFDRAGLLAMANAGPDTNGSQFFITFAPAPWLNNGYTIFGELVEGQDVLNALSLRDPESNPTEPGDVIERIDIVEGTG